MNGDRADPSAPVQAPGPDPGAPIDRALAVVRERIAAACARAGRDPADVTLIGVTKTVPVAAVRGALAAGLHHFGENYGKDLATKAQAVPATWHFIGKLQVATAARVAEHAHVVHSGEPGRALAKVGRRAAQSGRDISCLAQVDFTGARQGVAPEEADRFIDQAPRIEGIRLVGLMTIPPLTEDAEGARPYFRRLRELRDRLARVWPDLRELSMGMSTDLEIAVEEGATMVRVGTALFGGRPGKVPKPGADPPSR